ncbi:MAG: hypothetical protein HZC37_04315 [Burkholderiales bacterium]|nr:hypothetical protein [Burkholderiales bacterium]
MSKNKWLRGGMVGALAMAVVGVAQSQAAGADVSCPRTRAEVRDECVAFMKTHRWDEAAGDWLLKSGAKSSAKLPEGVTPREKVKAERDAFLRANKWNEAGAQWEPLGAKTRDLSQLSRVEVQKETAAFMRTHQWDEGTAAYVLKGKK